MREIFTDKNFIASKTLVAVKVLLVVALIIFFLPLVILPFFNHPCADDYICGYQLQQKGFFDYQASIYTLWGGRFAATFSGALFAHHNFLYEHYYVHSLLLIVLNFISIFFAIVMLNKYFLREQWSFSKTALISFVFLALEICSLPEPSTFIFWFSSAITYQLPIGLLQTEFALLVLTVHSKNKTVRIICSIILPALIFLINGFNELFIVVQFFLFLLLFYFNAYRKISKTLIIVMMLSFITSAAIVVFAPGNASRDSIIEPKGIYLGTAAIFYHCAETLWSIFKNPFAWFVAVIVFIYGVNNKNNFFYSKWITRFTQNKLIFPLIIIGFLIASIGFAVIGLKGGIIPDRYLNGVAYFVLLLLLMYVFFLGFNSNSETFLKLNGTKKIWLYSLIIIGIFCNRYIVDAYKSMIAAPLYDSIMTEREKTLHMAAESKTSAIVDDYNLAIEKHLNTDYRESPVTLRSLVQQKPPFLFFQDDLADEYSISVLRNFYHVDSIKVKKKD
jgi:Family of unknown function (DUF6056)